MISSSPLTAALRSFWPHFLRPQKSDEELLDEIRTVAAALRSADDQMLALKVEQLRQQVAQGQPVTSRLVMVTTFALVYEAARRILGIELYDVQLIGGLALTRGAIAEMQTGEGKTFTALLPASTHALAGRGVHVMTVNQYLAERDFELLAPVYRLLGLSAGLLRPGAAPSDKRSAYAADITYGPGYEFGFDYLRDQVTLLSQKKPCLGETFQTLRQGRQIQKPQRLQRGHAVAIVDEADSVLIDEATTPLILSAGGDQPASNAVVFVAARRVARQFQAGRDYIIDDIMPAVYLTQEGQKRLAAHDQFKPPAGLERAWASYIQQALNADHLFHRDVHYIVSNDQILIVDRSTGRIFRDRTWRNGLQQAVQAKEGVTITEQSQSIARITRQRFFRMYNQLCGMTGTAQLARRELLDVYKKEVTVVPPHKPCRRVIQPLRVFADRQAKERAIVEDVERIHRTGQPVLVGTPDIETSHRLSHMLNDRKLQHQLLNGCQDADEATIVAAAGQLGTVTIATNMAGRGTDIVLGSGVFELGGLHVVAVEAHESSRVDRQLFGRAARQGDPGSCQMFVSADDRLFTRYAPALRRRIRQIARAKNTAGTELAGVIDRLQRQIERQHSEHRRALFDRDDWLDNILRELND